MDITILPESTATLAAQNAPPRFLPYQEVDVLLIGWRGNSGTYFGQNLDRMGAFLKYVGYRVSAVYGDEEPHMAAAKQPNGMHPSPIARGGSVASACGVTQAFKDIFRGETAPDGGKYEQRRRLLIIGYFGHGNVDRNEVDGGRSWLYGGQGQLRIPMSYLQEYARDWNGAVDTLFIPETCHGGFDGMRAPMGRYDFTISETLAAGPGDKLISSDLGPNTYSSRLIGAMFYNLRYGLTVKELHEQTFDSTLAWAPGFYRSDGVQDRSILLAPMPGSPAALGMPLPEQLHFLPDTIIARRVSARESAWLATWSMEEKRQLLRLHRDVSLPRGLIAATLNDLLTSAAIRQGAANPSIGRSPEECAAAIEMLSR